MPAGGRRFWLCLLLLVHILHLLLHALHLLFRGPGHLGYG